MQLRGVNIGRYRDSADVSKAGPKNALKLVVIGYLSPVTKLLSNNEGAK